MIGAVVEGLAGCYTIYPVGPIMADIEVHIDLEERTHPVGLPRSSEVRGSETIVFDYASE